VETGRNGIGSAPTPETYLHALLHGFAHLSRTQAKVVVLRTQTATARYPDAAAIVRRRRGPPAGHIGRGRAAHMPLPRAPRGESGRRQAVRAG
jgi:hypothetical protein